MKKISLHFCGNILAACFLLLALFSSPLDAKLVYQTATAARKYAPNSASDVVMLSFTLNSDGPDINVNKLRIKNNSTSVRFGQGIKSVHLYRDSGIIGALEEDTDAQIAILQSLPQGTNPEQFLSFTNELVSSANLTNRDTKSFLITYDFDQSKGKTNLLGTTNVTLLEILTSDASNDLDLASETIEPTNNSVTITGVSFLKVTDIAPAVVLPGQKKVPMFAVSMAVAGENIGSTSEVTFTLYNEQNNLVTTSGQTNGVVQASMYFSETPPPEGLKFLDLDPKIVKTSSDTTIAFRSKSTFDFKFPPYISGTTFQGFNGGLNGVTENFYIFYDIGKDIPVTAETKISAQLIQFQGYGVLSNLPSTWPLAGEQLFDPVEVLVAGLSLESITSLIPRNTVFSVRNTIPMLELRLRANHSAATLNAITIVNSGSIKFQTSTSKTNIVRVQLYEDSNGDGELSLQQDTRIGNILLGSKDSAGAPVNSASIVKIPIAQETSPTINGLFIEQYDSEETYPRNKEKAIFVVYESGDVISTEFDTSGNITRVANAKLGDVDATAILEIEDDEVTTNVVTLGGITKETPRASSPLAAVEFNQGANVSIVSASDISPTSVIQGEILVPMLSLTLVAKNAFSSTNIVIFNESQSFLSNNTGVTKVWIYKDLPPLGSFDGSDVFLGATSTFISQESASVGGIPLALGDNRLLVLYSIGQDSRGSITNVISEGFIKAQLSDITSQVENETLVLSGVTPIPEIPASVDVLRSPITSVIIDSPSVEDSATTFNVRTHLTNSSESDVTLESISMRVYLSQISGPDITYEFSTAFANGRITTIPAGESIIQNFTTRHSNALTEGTGVIDLQVKYSATPSSSALISRYLGSNGWHSAAQTPRAITLQKTATSYPWIFPSYIDSIQYQRGNDIVPFSEGMALRSSDTILITFKEKGAFIDTSSFRIFKNGILQSRSDLGLQASNSFSYDSVNGVLTITNLGENDGNIQVFVSDGTNDLTPLSFTYAISSIVKIVRPLFFPNPYPLGSQDLTLGFNLTQLATVDFYIFNYVGLEVFRTSEQYTKTGYNTLTISKNSKVLAQGIYLCKMIATDNNGNKSVATVKLSVY